MRAIALVLEFLIMLLAHEKSGAETSMNELDFTGKTVLVVGGSSGIGNGIAQAFRAHGATVHICGTRPKASDYRKDEGSDLDGLHYTQLDVSSPQAIETTRFPFERLD